MTAAAPAIAQALRAGGRESAGQAAERELIDRALTGDDEAWRELHRRFHARILAVGRRMGREYPEDFAQEVWMRIFCVLGRFERKSALRTWIERVAVNEARMERRRDRRMKRGRPISLDQELASGTSLAGGGVPAGSHDGASLLDIFAAAEDRSLAGACDRLDAARALAGCRPEDSELLIDFYYAGASIGEMARARGSSAAAIKSRLYAARSAARAAIPSSVERAGE